MKLGRLVGFASLLAALAGGTAAAGDRVGPPPRTLALIVGVNRSLDEKVAPLRYADDDAVRYRDLFRTIGARTVTLASLDDNTRRLHPGAAAEARPARLADLTAAVERLAAEAAQARRAGLRVVFYFAYAGHGRVQDGSGSITLEDAHIGGRDLVERVIDKIAADESHVIVDACHSYFLVLGRGPGGSRRPMGGFLEVGALAERRDVGLLLSTSAARESHEWAAFQAGVFSQEVRSGLYGAADADRDGVVSYAEIGAFVERANVAIRNERYRPEIYARPPAQSGAGGGALVDLRPALSRRIEVAVGGGHQFLEDTSGVRLADFHNDVPVRLVRPADGRLYLRRTADDREMVLPAEVAVLRTAELPLVEPRSSTRNAANDAFGELFAMPFDVDAVVAYRRRDLTPPDASLSRFGGRSWWMRSRTWVGLGLGAAAVVSGAWGTAALLDARSLRNGAGPTTSQQSADALNDQISGRNRQGGALVGAGAAAMAAGLVSLFWPEPTPRFEMVVGSGAVTGGIHGTF